MIKLKRVPVYRENGKSNITHLVKKKGVYFIYDRSKLVYIGHSQSNLYKTILRHFQVWKDQAQPFRVTYAGRNKSRYSVKVYLTNAYDAPILEETLILKHRPRDNKSKVKTYSDRQSRRAMDRYRRSIPRLKKQIEAEEDWKRFSYSDNGELVDENGDVIF